MSLVAQRNGPTPDRPYQYGGILPFLGAIAGFVAKAVPVVTSIFSGVQQVRAAVAPPPPPPPPEPVYAAPDAGDDVDAWLASLSDDDIVQLAIEEGLIDPAVVNAEMETREIGFSGDPGFAPFTAPAIRTSAVYTACTQFAGFGRDME